MKAQRHNEGKLSWSILDFKALEPLVKVMMYGEKKYARHNWKNGMDMQVIMDCAMRHMTDLLNGETIDLESGLPIVGHLMANIMMISHYQQKEETDHMRDFVKELMSTMEPERCCGNWDDNGKCKCNG